MKTTFKLLTTVMLLSGLHALADPVRTYVRAVRNNSNLEIVNTYKLYDSESEVGSRFFPGGPNDNPCVKGFVNMKKSTESNAIVYLADKKLPNCEGYRFVFRDGDMSAGYRQTTSPNTDFVSVAESLKDWDERGIKPEMRLKD